MDISAATWNTVSKLLDEALDLEPAARSAWIERLGVTQPDLAPLVRTLLVAHDSAESVDVLAQLPVFSIAACVTASAPVPGGLAVGTLVGPYRLKREIDSGGMADLWLAERADGAFEREVALKLPRLTRLRSDLAARFAHERDILARLEHPYIARFYDAGVSDDGLPFLAMEYVHGQRITQWCNERSLDVVARLRLFGQVLEAVQFAHANLIIHRDLKPSNILVTASGQVRLLDFGIAKLLTDGETARETQLTQSAGRILTPDYASPEQIKGEVLTTASDVYSLAVVLYELLTGQLPYRLQITSAAQLEEAIVNAAPMRPSGAASAEHAQSCGTSEQRLRRALAGDLDTIILKALSKEPTQRYGSVTELAQDLERHLAGEPVLARPASWQYRARTFVRRNRLAVGAAAAISVALIAGASVSLWQAQRARAQAVRAEEVKNFVLSIFADADTSRGGSRSTTGLDLLRQARERLATAPVTDPTITADLLNAVGYGLVGLGEPTEAIPVFEQGLRLAATSLGADHPTTISIQINLCEAYLTRDDVKNAERVVIPALASARRSGDVKQLVEALRWMGSVRMQQGRYDESLKQATESVRLAEAKLTNDRHSVLLAQWTYAQVLWAMKEPGALEAARRTYQLARDYWGGQPNPEVLSARSFYAVALSEKGDAQAAIAELRAVRAEQIRLFGGISYVDVVLTNRRIGLAALDLGDPVAAMASFREAMEGVAAQPGGGSQVEIAKNRRFLGLALLDARRFDEAEAELRRAYAVLAPIQDPQATKITWFLATVLSHDGRLDEAEAMLAPSLAKEPAAIADLAQFKRQLGQLRSAQGRHQDAVSLLREAEELNLKSGMPSQSAVTLATLGGVQLAAGSTADALTTLERGDMLLDKVHPHGSPEHADLLINLARAQLELGHTGDAVAAAARADEFWSAFDAGNRQAGLAALWHAEALRAVRQMREASACWQRASATLAKAALPSDHDLMEQARRDFQVVAVAR